MSEVDRVSAGRRGLSGPVAGMAPAVLRAARHVLPGAGRRRRRDDGPGVPGHHQPHGRGRRPGADGAGDHPVHGQGVRCPPQPRGEHRVRAARRLPVVAGARLHRRRNWSARPWPPGSCRPSSRVSATFGSNYPAPDYSAGDAFVMEAVLTFGLVSVILGTASGAQNLGIIGALGVGGYIALAGPVGQPDLRRLDEPGPHLRARRSSAPTSAPTGCTSPARCRRRRRRRHRLRPPRSGRWTAGSGAAQGALFTEAAEPRPGPERQDRVALPSFGMSGTGGSEVTRTPVSDPDDSPRTGRPPRSPASPTVTVGRVDAATPASTRRSSA